MKIKRISAFVIVFAMVLGMFSGCTKEKKTSSDSVTELKMVLVGDKPVIFDEIYSKLNEMLAKDAGAKLDIEYISWGDTAKKYPLLFAANESFDIVFSARWQGYVQYAAKNGFYELNLDEIKKWAPKTYETIPEIAWEQAKVNGKIFMIPNNALEYNTSVIAIRGDIREKYNLGEIETFADFEKYLETVAANEKELIPFVDISRIGDLMDYGDKKAVKLLDSSIDGIEFNLDDPSGNIYNRVFQPEYEGYAQKRREMSKKGCWPVDIASNKVTNSMFEMGKCATYVSNIETLSANVEKIRKAHPEWKIEVYDISKGVSKSVNNFTGNGLSLGRNTKNVQKALEVIELLRNDERYYNLTNYGIEGKHWEKVEGNEKAYKNLNPTLPESERYVPGCVWGWKNEALIKYSVDEIEEKQEFLERWKNEETVEHKLLGFNLDDSNIRNEIASISNVSQQYGSPLQYGMLENVKEGVQTYRNQLKSAGCEKVIEDVKKQISDYIK